MCVESKLTDKQKEIIKAAYNAVMNHTATPEQELVWRFLNDFNCIYTWSHYCDEEYKQNVRDVIENNISM